MHKDYSKDLGALQHNENLLMNLQIWIHMFLPYFDHDRSKAFNFSGFPLKLGLTLGSKHGLPHQAIPVRRVELIIEMLNISPDQAKVSIWLTRKNVVHKHIQTAAQQMLINTQRLAVHPVRVEAQNWNPFNLQQQASLETFIEAHSMWKPFF